LSVEPSATFVPEPARSIAAIAPLGSLLVLVDFFSHAPPIKSGVHSSASNAFDTPGL
jgi:hypothetical protein